jgi:hypothetical protein
MRRNPPKLVKKLKKLKLFLPKLGDFTVNDANDICNIIIVKLLDFRQ